MSLCFDLKAAYRFHGAPERTKNGLLPVWFGRDAAEKLPIYADSHELLLIPCGQCIGCQLHRAAEWALRCMHEARYYAQSAFLTLTYKTEHLPAHRSLCKADFQKFMKRLRIHLTRQGHSQPLKYFMVGEYGEHRQRPHYHAILYGYAFPDREPVPNNPGAKFPLFDSKELAQLWGKGAVRIGDVTAESCNYVARYTMKKVYGKAAKVEYEATQRIAPYNACSKGIGRRYFSDFRGDCFPSDYLIHEDTKARVPIPRFYDKIYQQLDPQAFAQIKERRKQRAGERHSPLDSTPERMKVREEIYELKTKRLRRIYEEDRS